MNYYPAFLDLRQRRVLVVGGGRVAQRKVRQLLESGARVRVVSPGLTPPLIQLARTGDIAYRQGEFEETDLDGVCLAIGATDDRQVNERVSRAARRRNLFCNIVDVPPLCSFIAPAIVTRGDVLIAISTSGRSPTLAGRLKREIETQVGPEYGQLADLLGRWRPQVMEQIPHHAQRAEVFRRLVESDILALLRTGQLAEAERRVSELIEREISRQNDETIPG